eukprot:PhF_6_TR41195/c0_g1_i1/m.62340
MASANRLDEFVKFNNLRPVNVNFPGKKRTYATQNHGGTLDYVLVRERFASSCTDVRRTVPPVTTDHFPLIANISMPKWKVEAKIKPRPPATRTTEQDGRRFATLASLLPCTSLVASLGNQVSHLSLLSGNSDYPDFVISTRIASETLPQEEQPKQEKRSWNSDFVQCIRRLAPQRQRTFPKPFVQRNVREGDGVSHVCAIREGDGVSHVCAIREGDGVS